MSATVKNLYSKRAEERRRQFNNIINGKYVKCYTPYKGVAQRWLEELEK